MINHYVDAKVNCLIYGITILVRQHVEFVKVIEPLEVKEEVEKSIRESFKDYFKDIKN